jgi:hypothetical protein
LRLIASQLGQVLPTPDYDRRRQDPVQLAQGTRAIVGVKSGSGNSACRQA